MSARLPHVREPFQGEPDVCVHCHEEWVDLLTLYETDECSVRLRAEVDRLRSEVAELRALGVSLHKSAAMGRDAERAAVVAWLRGEVDAAMEMHLPVRAATFLECGEAIERGEHRREGDE